MRPIIKLKFPATCAECKKELPTGAAARYYGAGKVYGVGCHEKPEEGLKTRTAAAGALLAALTAADGAALEAYRAYKAKNYRVPVFAVVENARDAFHDPSRPEEVVGTLYDVCGFVWLEASFREGQRLIREFKRDGVQEAGAKRWKVGGLYQNQFGVVLTRFELSYSPSHSTWSTGWTLHVPSVGYGNGAMGAMESAGAAFARTMTDLGYPGVSVQSRID